MASWWIVIPSSLNCTRTSPGDILAAVIDSAFVIIAASKCLPANPPMPENVRPHDLHGYRCTGPFLLHLRLPFLTISYDRQLLHLGSCRLIRILQRGRFHQALFRNLCGWRTRACTSSCRLRWQDTGISGRISSRSSGYA